jgi:hypothetical protein
MKKLKRSAPKRPCRRLGLIAAIKGLAPAEKRGSYAALGSSKQKKRTDTAGAMIVARTNAIEPRQFTAHTRYLTSERFYTDQDPERTFSQ